MSLKPRSLTVPIYDGDDFEQITDLHRQVEIAKRHEAAARLRVAEGGGEDLRAGDDDGSQELRDAQAEVKARKDAYEAFVREAADRAEMWVLNPIGHEEYRALLKAHPPRTTKRVGDDGNEVEDVNVEDSAFGVNTDTFPKALLMFVDPDDDEIRTIAEPVFASEAERRRRVKRLSAGEFDTLWIRATSLNSGLIADPKAELSSPVTRTSDAT